MYNISQKILKFICILCLSCFLFSSCENNIEEVKAFSNKGVNTEEATDIESLLSVGGKIKAKLTAPLMISSERDTTTMTFPKSLHVIFFDDSTGLPSSFLYAKYGIYYKSLGKVQLKDSVVATTIGGDTLRTTELWWNQNTQDIYSDKPSILTQSNPYGFYSGKKGFHAKQDFSEFVFLVGDNSVFEQDSLVSF